MAGESVFPLPPRIVHITVSSVKLCAALSKVDCFHACRTELPFSILIMVLFLCAIKNFLCFIGNGLDAF